jgi:hypothetical protein
VRRKRTVIATSTELKVAFKRILPNLTNEKSDYGMKFYVILEMRTGFGLNLKITL